MPLCLPRTLAGGVVLSFVLLQDPFPAIGQDQQASESSKSDIVACTVPVDKPRREDEAVAWLKKAVLSGQVQTQTDSPLVFRGTSALTDDKGSKGAEGFSVTQGAQKRISREDANATASREQKNPNEVRRFISVPFQRPIKELIPLIKGNIEDENQVAVWLLTKDERTVTIRVSPVLKSHNKIKVLTAEPVIDLTFDSVSSDVIQAKISPMGCGEMDPGAVETTQSYSDFRSFGARRLPSKITSTHGKEQRVQAIESVEETKN